MRHLPYNKNLKQFSRNLRNHSTPGEINLWRYLKGKKVRGYGFNRQKIIGNYIADFFCAKLKLVVEIDGHYHTYEEQQEKDFARTKALEEWNLTILRFTEKDAVEEVDRIIGTIENYIEDIVERQ